MQTDLNSTSGGTLEDVLLGGLTGVLNTAAGAANSQAAKAGVNPASSANVSQIGTAQQTFAGVPVWGWWVAGIALSLIGITVAKKILD